MKIHQCRAVYLRSLAVFTATQAWDLFSLDGKLVVIGDFFTKFNISISVNDNLLLLVNGDNLGTAIRL
jgi:hypothetical protein